MITFILITTLPGEHYFRIEDRKKNTLATSPSFETKGQAQAAIDEIKNYGKMANTIEKGKR